MSPLLAATFGYLNYKVVHKAILSVPDLKESLNRGYKFYPALIGVVLFINFFFIIYKGSPRLALDKMALWEALLICFGLSVVLSILITMFFVPHLKKSVEGYEVPNEVSFYVLTL